MSKKDYHILRQLGRRIREKSEERNFQYEKLSSWKALNGLEQSRPMFMIDQLPWNEMIGIDELEPQCENPLLRKLEVELRRSIFKFTHFEDDTVILPEVRVPKALCIKNFGLDAKVQFSDNPIAEEEESSVHGQAFTDQLKSEDDLYKIGIPTVEPLDEENREREEICNEIFADILEVKMCGALIDFHAWDRIVEWHGVTESIMDLLDRPEFMHKVIDRTLESRLTLIDELSKHKLLDVGNPIIHCTGAYTDELPGYDYEHETHKELECGNTKHMWTFGAAQIFATVSPAMHEEFDIQYAKRWYDRFGLGYYGCCEPLDTKIDIIRNIPNVRKISISPWADVERAAEAIHGDYVISSKPSPAYFANSKSLDLGSIQKDLEQSLESANRHGCNIEFILKDVSTIQKDVQKLKDWAHLAASICGRRVGV